MNHDIKELLSLAAKACGLNGKFCSEDREGEEVGGFSVRWVDEIWMPHTDDCDCFRMETALGVEIYWRDTTVAAAVFGGVGFRAAEKYADHNGDKNAARRLASLRVAAELGRRLT